MKLEPATKLNKRNKATSKNFDDDFMAESCDVIAIFLIYGQVGAIWKPDSGRIVSKTYISINSNLLSYKNWKRNLESSNTAPTLLLWVKVLFWPKNADFFQNNADISKIKAWPAILFKKRLWHRCFPVNFAKFLRTPFFTEHLRWLLPAILQCPRDLELAKYNTFQSFKETREKLHKPSCFNFSADLMFYYLIFQLPNFFIPLIN